MTSGLEVSPVLVLSLVPVPSLRRQMSFEFRRFSNSLPMLLVRLLPRMEWWQLKSPMSRIVDGSWAIKFVKSSWVVCDPGGR